jgi:opacity protein-like surface antigen
MQNLKILTIAASLALTTLTANANELSADVALTSLSYKEDGFSSAKPKMLRSIIQYKQSDSLSYETLVGIGTSEGSIGVYGATASIKVKYAIGGYARFNVPLGDSTTAFARAGLTHMKLDATASGFGGSLSFSDSGTGATFGLGLEQKISDALKLTVDYTSYYNKDGVKVGGASIGAGFKF